MDGLVALRRIRPGSHRCGPVRLCRGRLKPVMLLKLFIFHIQWRAHRERGILAMYYGMQRRCSAAGSICEPDSRSAALGQFVLSVVSLLTHTEKHTDKNMHSLPHTHTKENDLNFKSFYFTPVWRLRTSWDVKCAGKAFHWSLMMCLFCFCFVNFKIRLLISSVSFKDVSADAKRRKCQPRAEVMSASSFSFFIFIYQN